MRHIAILILITGLFTSCASRFEKNFYYKLEEGIKQYKATRKPVNFNLADITNFNWDKMLLITGSESVPVSSQEIEKHIGQRTNDLGLNKDRFYFFNNNKLTKEIEINHGYYDQAYIVEICSDKNSYLTVNNSIFYVGQGASYKYSLEEDIITIKYPDYTYKAKLSFQGDTLVMNSEKYGETKFWRFEN